MTETRPAVADLSPAKLRLLARRLKGKKQRSAKVLPPIVPNPADRLEPFPLTDVQQAYWLGRSDLFEMGNVASHGYSELEFQGLDIARLQSAWDLLITRHDMLRAIVTEDGQQQVLERVPPYEIEVLDLRGRESAVMESELEDVRRRMSHQVLPADRWPLFELRATRLDDDRVLLHLSFDILIADLWSFRQLLQELNQLYEQPGVELPHLDITFRDYVVAEVALEGSPQLERSKAYWLRRLPELPAAPQLPLACDPASLAQPRFQRRRAILDARAWRWLKKRASRSELTPSGLLLAAFSEVLATWSKDSLFTVNVTLFNRLPLHPQINQVIGDFTSLTLLAVDGSRAGSFEERARAIQQQLWKDLEHRHFGGVRVLRELARDAGMAAPRSLMPIVFTSALFEQAADEDGADVEESPGGRTRRSTPGPGISQTPQVWLDHQVREQEGELVFNWDAVEDLFPEQLLDDMFDAYCGLLERLAESERHWTSSRRDLLPATHRAMQARANDTVGADPKLLLHEPFEQQAAQRPGAVAVIAKDRRLSYGELQSWSRALGRRLRQRGARPNQLVAVVMEKGWEQVVGVLGILQSGAAYLPISADLPEARIHHLLAHGEVSLAVTQSRVDGELAWPEGVKRVLVDELEPGEHEAPLSPAQKLEDLAYVIFTSGSTGQPKGVMIDHRGAVNTILDINDRFSVGPEDRVLALASLGFDLSVYDVFGLLAAGGTLVLPEPSAARDPSRWLQLVLEAEVTIWNSVPALMEMLATFEHPDQRQALSRLRLVMMSGDWIPVSLPDRLRQLGGETEIISLGGATEASIWSILYPIEDVDPEWSSVPYGRPMRNQHFYVLDQSLESRPQWVPGDLYIGGIGLALGYWRDEERTSASFVRHPESGERLYRTGDLGRYLPDSNIEFLGREDLQVKVQGHRIELGEIEATLERHASVRSAAVMPVGQKRAYRHLVAYVVPELPDALDLEALRCHLESRLPDYMVPKSWSVLDALPLTSNGKVDRRSLPDPEAVEGEPTVESVAPRTPMERELAALWTQVLELEEVSVHDNFFTRGGNSLLAIQLVMRVRESFGVEVPLRGLFDAPTISELTELVGRLRAEVAEGESAGEVPRTTPDPDRLHEPFPLTDIQQAYWIGRTELFELGNVASHAYSEIMARELDLDWLSSLLRQLIERHAMLRTVFLPDGRQRVLEEVPPYEIEVLDLRGVAEQEAERQLNEVRRQMSHQVMPADRWPLFEVRATLEDEDATRLHVSIDILVADGWSAWLLRKDLGRMARGEHLEPLAFSFRDYVVAETALEGSPLMRRSEAYWRDRLPTLPPAPQLPLAKDPGSLEQPRFRRRRGRLAAGDWRRLKERARSRGITPSGVLLAAFAEALATWCKEPRFTLNVTTFRRLPFHSEVDEVVGDFTSLTLLEVDTALPGGFDMRARALQEQLWQDLEHRYFSGVRLQRELARQQGGTHRALMPVVFTSLIFSDGQDDEAEEDIRAGLQQEPDFGISQTPQVWLDHQVREDRGALDFNWDAVEELFPDGLLDGLFEAFYGLLSELASSDERWRSTERGLIPADQRALCAEVNATESPISLELLHMPFERQAAQHPEHLALVAGARRLSYGELQCRARSLGRRLRASGARPNRLVAVVMEKGWEQVVAVLGVTASGAAYLPIDPALPEERVHYLLAHGEVEMVLTQARIDTRLAWPAEVERIRVDELEATADEAPLEPIQEAQDLAYVIFTSGSTGLPKGVMIDHRGALNTILDINQRFAVVPGDRVLGLSSLSFDLSVWDIFGTLAAGATLILPEAASLRDPQRWSQLVAAEEVSVWNSVPALLEMLTEYGKNRPDIELGSLRLAMLSGDWIPLGLPDKLRELAGELEVISLGGATEASIWSILFPIEAVDPEWPSIPYGRPMINQQFHVLDAALEPRPVWVPGELCISGIGLAQGYWRDPEKTAASFIKHPRSGERLYRTGDLGRVLPDGTIEFLGREDFQVKIQGHRIELGEIESVLEQHPGVRSAVVAPVGEARAYRQLAAYLVPDSNAAVGSDESAGEGDPAVRSATFDADRRETRDTAPPGSVALASRQSTRGVQIAFPSDRSKALGPMPGEAFYELLGVLQQARLSDQPLPKYRYPSAGDLYGVQALVYVQPNRVEGVPGGSYYYHPIDHCLVRLSERRLYASDLFPAATAEVFESAAFTVFLVGELDAVAPIYGADLAPAFLALEAGYIAQELTTSAAGQGLGLTLLAGAAREPLRTAFALKTSQVVLFGLAAGEGDSARGDEAVSWADAVDWGAATGSPDSLRAQAEIALASTPQQAPLSQLERLELKLRQPGIRRESGLPTVSLPKPEQDAGWLESYRARRSVREYLEQPLLADNLGRWLSCLRQQDAHLPGGRR
ncbi:MAG: amino acid adenylation domain-containing protein [Acidobacteriota bacterium]